MNLWFALHDRNSSFFNGVNALSTTSQATKAWGWSDSGSYLQMGIAEARFGHLTPELMWTANFWPPGMSYVYAFAIKLVGLEGQFIFVLAALTAFLWAFILALLLKTSQWFMKYWIALVAIALLVQTDLYHEYLVRDAIIWSDGYAAGFLCLSLIFTVLGSKTLRKFYFIASGVSLAILIHLRGQYFVSLQILGVMTLVFGIIWSVITCLRSCKHTAYFYQRKDALLQRVFLPFLLIFIVSFTACLPYLFWQKSNIGDLSWDLKGKWHWTSTEAFAVAGNWYSADDMAGFISQGGGGTACKVDQVLCAKINRAEKDTATPFNIYDETPYSTREFSKMTRSTFTKHPIKWFIKKSPYVYRYWISSPAITSPTTPNYIAATVSAIGLVTLVVASLFRPLRNQYLVPIFMSIVMIGLTVGPPYLAHFEVRYLVAVKLIGLISFLGYSGFFLTQLMARWKIKTSNKPNVRI